MNIITEHSHKDDAFKWATWEFQHDTTNPKKMNSETVFHLKNFLKFSFIIFMSFLIYPVSVSSALTDANLISNPSFENGSTTPLYWTFVTNSGNTPSWDTISHSGARSVRVQILGTRNKISGYPKSDLISAQRLSNYTFSAWVKTEGASRPAVRVVELDTNKNQISNINLTFNEGTNDWTEKNVSFISSPKTAYLYVYANIQNGYGTFWIDDVTLNVNTTPTPSPTPLLTPTVTPTTIGSSNVALSSVGGIASGGRRDANLMIDGITTGYTGSSGYAVAPVNIPMTITLKQVYTIDRIRILLWDLDNRYYRYYVQTSTDNSIWTTVIDRTSGQWQSWQDVTFAPINVKYIRIVGTFNSVNTDYNIVELEAYSSSLTPTPTPSPTPSSTGTNYYMSPSGSDSNSGTISSPWKTVGFASSKLKPGDTLYARGGTYTGQYGWNSPSGTSLAPITWKAYPGETPIFDGQGSSSGGNFININGLDWLIFDGITVENYKSTAAFWIGYVDSSDNCASGNSADYIVFRNMNFYDMGTDSNLDHAVYLSCGVKNAEISNSKFFRTSGAAIHFYHAPGVAGAKIYNNIIDGGGKSTWGIVLRENSANVEIYNNIIVNSYWNIDMAGSGSAIIKNNILGTPLDYPTGSITASNNMFLSGTPNDGSSSSFVGNAWFVNPSIGDYHLQSSSDAIDKGTTIPLVTNDIDGNGRPAGLAYDIGAYEYR